MTDDVHSQMTELVRKEWPGLVATLLRDFGDLTTAEDAAQEAAIAALTSWLDDGIPDRPGAWITTVARRRALDRLRREKTGRAKLELIARLEDRLAAQPDLPGDADMLRDDQLRLFFGCCHPALSIEAQIALTLRSIGGLTTTEIARAFLVSEATMAQRLVRAKRKISSAAIPFRIPADAELLNRLTVVHQVLYLLFNEGYEASGGTDVVRASLCDEAIRLTRLLGDLMASDAETLGLLALMLFIDARRLARQGEELILLDAQNRSLWDQAMIAAGTEVLDRAMRRQRPGPFQIEAAINALHCQAETADATDWRQITALYSSLFAYRPTPIVGLNRAVAVAMDSGPEAGLQILDDPAMSEHLDDYRFFHAARADLLRRCGADRAPEAADAYRRALALTENDAERRFLRDRLDEVAVNRQ